LKNKSTHRRKATGETHRFVPYNGDSINDYERKHSFARRDSIFSKVAGHNFKKFIGGSMRTSTSLCQIHGIPIKQEEEEG